MKKVSGKVSDDKLVQTRVPSKLYQWVQAEAKRTHTTVAAWVRLRIWELHEGRKEKTKPR